MGIVWYRMGHARRSGWLSLLVPRVFSLRARMRDSNAKDDSASASVDSQPTTPSPMPELMGPGGGEDAAFNAFFAQHEHALYGYLRRMLPTHDAALDVAQEAFFRAWRHFETVRVYDRPQAWLFRVATNLALDVLRHRRRTGLPWMPSLHETSASLSSDTPTADASDMLSALTDPFDMERSLAECDLVNQTLSRLPKRQRAAVLLWAAHGLTCGEIAAALDTTEVNARQLLSRGRARFREVYEQAQ